MIDSVPPEVTVPTMSSPARSAPSIPAVIETISASIFAALGQTSRCSGLLCECSAYAAFRKAM